MSDVEYRAEFDATVTFSNGGGLNVEGFRVDVSGPDSDEEEVASLFVASLGLLMAERVDVRRLRVFPEAAQGHPARAERRGVGTGSRRRGLALGGAEPCDQRRHDDLPGSARAGDHAAPVPRGLAGHLRGRHGVRDRPDQHGGQHRHLPRQPLSTGSRAAPTSPGCPWPAWSTCPPSWCVRRLGLAGGRCRRHHGGGRRRPGGAAAHGRRQHWGTPDYARDAPYLTEAGARRLVEQGARLVGIDAVNIDDTSGNERPAHTLLLAAGIPVVEHLTGLEQLPPTGARFTAAPPRVAGFGTFPVRAFAAVPEAVA